jgi:hypothetical protein
VQGVQDSRHAFDRLSETAEDDTLVKWEAEATAAEDDRLHNPSSMDIYEVQLTKGVSQWDSSILNMLICLWHSTNKKAARVAPTEPSGTMARR